MPKATKLSVIFDTAATVVVVVLIFTDVDFSRCKSCFARYQAGNDNVSAQWKKNSAKDKVPNNVNAGMFNG